MRNCIYCGESFKKHGNKKFCSSKCQRLAYADLKYERRLESLPKKICKVCGKEFTVNHTTTQQICNSPECRKKVRKANYEAMYVELTCKHCGEKFKGLKHRKYCSKKCSGDRRIKPTTKKGRVGICKKCGKEYVKNHNDQMYCSSKCYGKSKEIKIYKPCENCGKQINVKWKGRRFCDKECEWEFKRKVKEKNEIKK